MARADTLPTFREFFLSKTRVGMPGDCWEWIAARYPNGYGHFGRYGLAHRVAYEMFVGPIPKGLDIDHTCRNRACVSPLHLEPVTRRENLLRSPLTQASKKRAAKAA